MAFRVELCTAGLLLLLSVLHSSQSAPHSSRFARIAAEQMANLGQDALKCLINQTESVMRNHSGSHSVGCIKEAKENEKLSCNLISTFNSYFQEATELRLGEELVDKLKAILQRVDDLKEHSCKGHRTTCEAAFQGRNYLEKLRSLLVLFQQWIVRPCSDAAHC